MDIKIIVDETVLREAMRLFASKKFDLPLDTEIRIDLGGDGIIATLNIKEEA